MKSKDYYTIAIVVIISLTASFFISKALVGKTGGRNQSAPVVDEITADFPLPDDKYFNCLSINPAAENVYPDPSKQAACRGEETSESQSESNLDASNQQDEEE